MLNNLLVNMWIQSTKWFALGASEASSLRNSQVSLGRGTIYESGMTTAKSRGPPWAKVRGVRATRGWSLSRCPGWRQSPRVDSTPPPAVATAGRLRVTGPPASSHPSDCSQLLSARTVLNGVSLSSTLEFCKIYIHMYIQLIHCAVCLKQIQHCKSTILQ